MTFAKNAGEIGVHSIQNGMCHMRKPNLFSHKSSDLHIYLMAYVSNEGKNLSTTNTSNEKGWMK
jgi:hypothetical protein